MNRVLKIYLNDDSDDDSSIVEQVTNLINRGFTSGYEPEWEIVNEETKEEKKLTTKG